MSEKTEKTTTFAADVDTEFELTRDGDVVRVQLAPQLRATQGIKIAAAMHATQHVLTGTAPSADDPQFVQDVLIAVRAYERALSEMCLWALVFDGDLMLRLTPAWAADDTHRRPVFLLGKDTRVVTDEAQ